MPNAPVPFLEMRGGCGRARIYNILILFFTPDHTPSRAREEERLAHIAELACGRSEAENQAQEREKNGTSGVHGSCYFAPHDTNNNFRVLGF
jgi:hypothetical protein